MELRERIEQLHRQLMGRLPDSDNEQITKFITVGEWGLAFETMCDQLVEHESMTSSSEWVDIEMLAHEMNFDVSQWRSISPGAR